MADEIMPTDHLEKPTLPTIWDYDISVDKAKISINKWRNVTVEFLCELWIARENLRDVRNSNKNNVAFATLKTWDSYCNDIGVDRTTVHRWLARAFELPHVAHNSGENEWYTPSEYIEAARQVLGEIDLDPASSEIANRTVKAKIYFTAEDDGLNYVWDGRVWMNPPYSSDLIGKFIEKLVCHYKNGDVIEAIILVNNATETNWFQILLEQASAVCFIKGRVKFIDMNGSPSGAPLQGQAILYLGDKSNLFGKVFEDFGKVLYA